MDILTAATMIIGGYALVRWMRYLRLGDHSVEDTGFTEHADKFDLDARLASVGDQPLLVFLHDPWCPISARAARQVAQVDVEVVTIDVSREHDLSRDIVRRTGIQHASPQAILIDEGVAVWSASHFSIDRSSIERALASSAAKGSQVRAAGDSP
jgi:bacillithiol system protein YtxJ